MVGPPSRRCRDCGRTLTRTELVFCARCMPPGSEPTDAAPVGGVDVAGPMITGNGLVFLQGGHVCFEMANFGRLELPPDVAETLARAFMRGAKMLREGKPADGTIILRGG